MYIPRPEKRSVMNSRMFFELKTDHPAYLDEVKRCAAGAKEADLPEIVDCIQVATNAYVAEVTARVVNVTNLEKLEAAAKMYKDAATLCEELAREAAQADQSETRS